MLNELKIQIGDHEVTLQDLDPENQDVQLLLAAALTTDTRISIRVSASEETAAALGRLQYAPTPAKEVASEKDTDEVLDKTRSDLLAELCKPVTELGLTTRASNSLQNDGIDYFWELVERSMTGIRGAKKGHYGRKSVEEIEAFLKKFARCHGWSQDVIRFRLVHLLQNLSTPTGRLPFPNKRARNILTHKRNHGRFDYAWQLAEATDAEILSIDGIADISLGDIKKCLHDLGLRTGMDLSAFHKRLRAER